MNPQYEAHERFCKSIGDMAKENNELKQRIKLLESVSSDPHALWANWLRGTVTLPVGIGDVREHQERIKRLESDAISDAISAKWMWMMNYCKAHGFSPTLGWESAEKAWTAAFEAKESKP